MLGLMFVLPLPLDISMQAVIAALGVYVRRDFTFRSPTHQFRIDLLDPDGVTPWGDRGPIYRLTAPDPQTGCTMRLRFCIPYAMALTMLQQPWLVDVDPFTAELFVN